MMDIQIHKIFPTVVIRGHVGRDFTEEEKDIVRYHANCVRENGGNHQSDDTHVFDNPELEDIKRICMEHVQAYIDQVFRPADPISPYITQSWFSYYNKGGYSNPHHHMNSILSGVVYFQAEEEVDNFSLLDTRYTPLLIPAKEYDELNSDEWVFGINTGTILIFRSDATHAVRVVQSEKTRICLAFNTYFDGSFGRERNLTELHLNNTLK